MTLITEKISPKLIPIIIKGMSAGKNKNEDQVNFTPKNINMMMDKTSGIIKSKKEIITLSTTMIIFGKLF